MSDKKIISPNTIKQTIVEEALKLKKKKELYESIKQINSELAQLNEIGMVGSFGFQGPNDAMNKSKTGFVNDFQNISHVAALAAEMAEEEKATAPINEDVLDEVAKLKEELQKLKEENETLKNEKK
jgi:chromosome segregation ATPase